MARLPRYFVKGQPQHIIQRGNNREPIFADKADYVFYLECLQDAVERYALSIHAYVLMTSHVHLLASPQFEDNIPKNAAVSRQALRTIFQLHLWPNGNLVGLNHRPHDYESTLLIRFF